MLLVVFRLVSAELVFRITRYHCYSGYYGNFIEAFRYNLYVVFFNGFEMKLAESHQLLFWTGENGHLVTVTGFVNHTVIEHHTNTIYQPADMVVAIDQSSSIDNYEWQKVSRSRSH